MQTAWVDTENNLLRKRVKELEAENEKLTEEIRLLRLQRPFTPEHEPIGENDG